MDTVTVVSRVPMAMKLQFLDREPIIINGSNHPDARDGVGLTENVDAAAFHSWMSDHADHDPVRNGLIAASDAKAEDVKVDEVLPAPLMGTEAGPSSVPGTSGPVNPPDAATGENHEG